MTSIYGNKLSESLKGKLPTAVLLWGDDAGMIRQATVQVKEAVAAQTGLDLTDPFAVENFGLSDVVNEESKLGDAAMTLSFTAPHRLITVGGISGTERADEIKALTGIVADVLKLPLQGVTLVLPVPLHLDKKHPLVKVVEGYDKGLAVRFFADTARDLGGFIGSELTRLGAQATREATDMLANNLGADREVARRELEKLVCYAGEERPITAAHVQASLCGATPSGVFMLAEAVLGQNPIMIERQLAQLLEQGEDLNGALMLTLGEFKKLALAKQLKAQGEADDAILAQCGKSMVPPAAKQVFLSAMRRYPEGRLKQIPERALEVLTMARSGLLPAEHVLARALLSWGI
jgi:DNA polymerase III delta subunit